ncbi:MAG: Histidine--tRNA ligase [Methanonatronarchaeales archaeon]|nr:Histidine--tRNA ligase [Methanonatronarchaeales archaeon]
MIRRPKGTRDLLPGEMETRRRVEDAIRRICESWGYREISTPVFEHLQLFKEKSGEDIVEELYAFTDRGDRGMALRPEATASIVRAYLQEMRADPKPVRLYYLANCFRYEQPQSGRYREFWQFGTEVLGGDTPEADAEAIALSDAVMRELGLENSLELGHLGVLRGLADDVGVPVEERDRLLSLIDRGDREAVRQVFGDEAEGALSILDVRGEAEEALRRLEDVLSPYDARDGLEDLRAVMRELERFRVGPKLNMGIARGLEYYTGAVFEAYAPGLGAQDQVMGGGSYELCSVFGGDEMRSTGFAFGFDRVVQALEAQGELPGPGEPAVYVAPVTTSVRRYAISVTRRLRDAGLRAEIDVKGRGIGAQVKHADSKGVAQLIVIGEREEEAGEVSLKDMESGEQVTLSLDDAVELLGDR